MAYVPGDSDSGMFGGNSNWRGPVWMPINFLLYTTLLRLYAYYGEDFKVECPTGSGQLMTLLEVAKELGERLIAHLPAGRRPARGRRIGAAHKFRDDPHWRELLLFYEYFHGDSGAGIGASHQTGWTGCVARIIQTNALLTKELLLAPGAEAAAFRLHAIAAASPRSADTETEPHDEELLRAHEPAAAGAAVAAAPAAAQGSDGAGHRRQLRHRPRHRAGAGPGRRQRGGQLRRQARGGRGGGRRGRVLPVPAR